MIQCQIHGYRQGHQLLASSVGLSKRDQSIVDRLSDVAGPLRPREQFDPYLTTYPLPGGEFSVVARTWQDLSVPRAGCVRTLSLLIPRAAWAAAPDVAAFLPQLALEQLPEPSDATPRPLPSFAAAPPWPPADWEPSELVEALFLEERRPVVVFDAPDPEALALRLLQACWPEARQGFALSTFALAPRSIDGRPFDLVFSPKDARGRFADWPGRRVDGQSRSRGRHPWTAEIARRVFGSPSPSLISDDERALAVPQTMGDDPGATLRILFLWNDLRDSFVRSPQSALGLLDIASSGLVRAPVANALIADDIRDAIERALDQLPVYAAWEFVGAMARKLHDTSLEGARATLRLVMTELTRKAPAGAISLMDQPDPKRAIRAYVPALARGLLEANASDAITSLEAATVVSALSLVEADPSLAAFMATNAPLIDLLAELSLGAAPSLRDRLRQSVLPLLVENWQTPAAIPLLDDLSGTDLAQRLVHLGKVNDFRATHLVGWLIDRACAQGSKSEVLEALTKVPQSARRDALLEHLLVPDQTDMAWLVQATSLPDAEVAELLRSLLHACDDQVLSALLTEGLLVRIVELAGADGVAVLKRAIALHDAPLNPLLKAVMEVSAGMRSLGNGTLTTLLWRSLHESFDGDASTTINRLFDAGGQSLAVELLAYEALGPDVPSQLASRNMVAFEATTHATHGRIVASVGAMGSALRERRPMDLSQSGIAAYTALLADAAKHMPGAILEAAGYLLPRLLETRDASVAEWVVALFPPIYLELARAKDLPDLLKFVPFIDWDRCKAARHALVDAFMSSSWAPGDLARCACFCGDEEKILGVVAKRQSGADYLARLAGDLDRVPVRCRQRLERALKDH